MDVGTRHTALLAVSVGVIAALSLAWVVWGLFSKGRGGGDKCGSLLFHYRSLRPRREAQTSVPIRDHMSSLP